MIKYVVIGDPVSHSRSPGMQNAAFEAAGMGRPYGRKHVPKESIASFVAYAREHLAGVNITVPDKEAVIPYLDEIDPAAARCQSVNTLVIRNGIVKGFSTDGYGLEHAVLENFGIAVAGNTFCFVGCGGACRAAACHMAESGARKIFLVNRTLAKAQSIARIINQDFPACEVFVMQPDDKKNLAEAIRSSAVLIQSTSLGLKEDDPAPFDLALLDNNPEICVFDTIYKNTHLLQHCSAAGLKHAGGRAMLIHQGAASFRLWTGLEPDLDAMNRGFDITPVSCGDGEE